MFEQYQKPKPSKDNVVLGIGLAFLLHLIQIPLGMFFYFIPLAFIGVSQLIYIIPAIVMAQSKEYYEMAKGLMIGAAMTFLLNAACAGVVFLRL